MHVVVDYVAGAAVVQGVDYVVVAVFFVAVEVGGATSMAFYRSSVIFWSVWILSG